MLKLYYSPGACSLASHIVLEEIGEPYVVELVSTMDGSTRTNEYLKINPKGRVPVLHTGKASITETSAIMTYLALSYPHSNLLENIPIGIARSIEWMSWLSGIHASIIAQNWRTERFSDDIDAHTGIQAKGMQNLIETYAQIDVKLQEGKWAAGDSYSIADPYLLVFFRWGNRLGLDMRTLPNWTNHANQIERRKAVQTVLAVEEICIWE